MADVERMIEDLWELDGAELARSEADPVPSTAEKARKLVSA